MARTAVDVGARVSQYEVTSTPLLGAVGRGRLRLVWVRPSEVLVEAAEGSDAVVAGGADAEVAGDAVGSSSDAPGTLAVLDAYRITRVPGRLAS